MSAGYTLGLEMSVGEEHEALPLRKIIHVDMDAFYASVEQRDDPSLRGRPIAVGGSRERGVVAAASYEARAFGVRSAMPSTSAKRRCPELIFVRPRFDVYRAVSQQIHAIFAEYTTMIEPLSLDEAYLDVTRDLQGVGSASLIAQQIRKRIEQETALTASAGVSYNKFLAKLASDQNKPNGMCVVTPQQGPSFVERLSVRRFHGVGPVTAQRMEQLGIVDGASLRAQSLDSLRRHFGKSGDYFYWAARGRDDRAVEPDRPRKSLGAERTFETDLRDDSALFAALEALVEIAWTRSMAAAKTGRTVTLKLKYSDFRQLTRARSMHDPVASREQLSSVSAALLRTLLPVANGVRLLGIGFSGFDDDEAPSAQLSLPLDRPAQSA